MEKQLRSKTHTSMDSEMKYKIGAVVLARWSNGNYYKAKIQKKFKESMIVKFVDDDVVYNVKNHLVKLWIENKKDQSSRQRRGKKSFNGKKGNAKELFTENKEPPSKLKMYTQETQTSPTLSQEVKVQSTNILDSACMSANFNSVISSKDEKSCNAAIDLSTDSSLSKPRSSRSSIYDFTETSESEYFPSEMELEESIEESIVNSNKEKTATANKSSGCENAITQESDGKIAVLPTMNDGKNRKWNKKYYCPFCEKPFSKLPRHMESAHPTEPEISALLALKKDEKSKKMREQILCKLRNIGNHRYNCEVQKKGEGGLLVVHRPSEDCADPNNYVPCPTCFGYFAQRELWKHKCLLKGESSSNRVLSVARSLIPVPYYVENNVKDILSTMRQDEITNIVRSDKTICEIMRRMFHAKGGVEHHKKNEIRGNARAIARFLQQIRKEKGGSFSIENCIDPLVYKSIIAAIRVVAGYDSNSQNYGKPELARKLGLLIKKCAVAIKSCALEDNNQPLLERSDNFIKLHELNFFVEIGAQAQRDRNERKRVSHKLIPLSEDVVKLNKYLKSISEENKKILTGEKSSVSEKVTAWTSLQKVTLCQILVFNRRREGEVSRMIVNDYLGKKDPNEKSEIIESLTKTEKALCQILTRIEIKGKCDKNVPVLLTPAMRESLDLLLRLRREVGVSPENKYLFASCTHGAQYSYRGSDCLRQFATDCGANAPETLRSTKLRKHVASVSQILNLKNNELDLLAKFMGHDIRIHREFYRLPDNVLQVAKLSKVLIALEKGQLLKEAGKSLDEMEVSLEEDLSEEDIFENIENDYDGSSDSESEIDQPVSKKKIQQKTIQQRARNQSQGKRLWTEKEVCAVERHLLGYILRAQIPGATQIKECMSKEPALASRSWTNIKDYCRNRITALARKK